LPYCLCCTPKIIFFREQTKKSPALLYRGSFFNYLGFLDSLIDVTSTFSLLSNVSFQTSSEVWAKIAATGENTKSQSVII